MTEEQNLLIENRINKPVTILTTIHTKNNQFKDRLHRAWYRLGGTESESHSISIPSEGEIIVKIYNKENENMIEKTVRASQVENNLGLNLNSLYVDGSIEADLNI